MRTPFLLFAIGAVGAVASAAVAQADRSPGLYQKVSEAAGGWVWYLNKTSVRPAGPRMHRFWMTGDYRGTGQVRHQMMQVKVSCDQPLHIPLHTTSFDIRGDVVADTMRGDSSSNWTRIQPYSAVAAARAWVCR